MILYRNKVNKRNFWKSVKLRNVRYLFQILASALVTVHISAGKSDFFLLWYKLINKDTRHVLSCCFKKIGSGLFNWIKNVY